MTGKLKVLIVDDDPLFRKALTKYIHQNNDLIVIGEASEMESALKALSNLKIDIALIDILGFEGEQGGIQMIREIKTRYKELPILAISSHESSLFAESALQAGAKGFLMKQEAADKIGNVIRQILNGEMYVSGETGAKIIRHHLKNAISQLEAN